jgi:hypothetical protein
MYISTFKEENINDSSLPIKSLFILAFLQPHQNTDYLIGTSIYRKRLLAYRNSDFLNNYVFISLNIIETYNLITKNLVEPINRKALNNDFNVVDSDDLYEYFRSIHVISNIVSLN